MKLNSVALRAFLPHRPPFLMVDRVIHLDPGLSGVGVKLITINDAILSGHFPAQPIMPGVLMVEACAQLAAIVLGAVTPVANGAPPLRAGYLASINRFKFLSLVVPGDQLLIDVRIGKRLAGMQQVSAEIRGDARQIVAGGELAVSLSA